MVAKIKRIKDDAKIPVRGSVQSAGYDLFACIKNSIMVFPGDTVKIGTGLIIEPPTGYFGGIFARSGLSTKHGIRPANCVGVCDNDYRGEYIVPIHNDSDEPYTINNGDRIAQLIFLPYSDICFEEVADFEDTDRGAGGFGSTGE